LLVAAVVAMFARRLRLPYSVGLVAAGMALAMLPLSLKITFTKELIFDTLLPPLIFEAAFYLRWNRLRRELPVVLTPELEPPPVVIVTLEHPQITRAITDNKIMERK